jgi:hypothetical protein
MSKLEDVEKVVAELSPAEKASLLAALPWLTRRKSTIIF